MFNNLKKGFENFKKRFLDTDESKMLDIFHSNFDGKLKIFLDYVEEKKIAKANKKFVEIEKEIESQNNVDILTQQSLIEILKKQKDIFTEANAKHQSLKSSINEYKKL